MYFEDPVAEGKMFMEIVTDNPELQFTPEKLLNFTRYNQKPVGSPGDQFHYSDTGYILLGLIIEEIEGKPYSDFLKERIFAPLGVTTMNDEKKTGSVTNQNSMKEQNILLRYLSNWFKLF